MANGWTSERKARQAILIKNWRPWEMSTGPKTEKGKACSAMRGYKGEKRKNLRMLSHMLRKMREDQCSFLSSSCIYK